MTAVKEAREPGNGSEVRSFLGLVGYSSRFISKFFNTVRAITTFKFGAGNKKAFKALKKERAGADTLLG